MENKYNAALYCRLSKDDFSEGESSSIVTQKMMLESYCTAHGFHIFDYYVDDTGFYYLQSRYYDPIVGRWISPEPNVDHGEFDEGANLLAYNVYTYCANNPIYTLEGTKVLRETWGNNTLIPLYDNEDSVCGIVYNNVPYYFLKNLQGDVIAITDSNGDEKARYSYDAWGVCTILQDTSACAIATVNPYRYRSYYFDRETQLYYLQSRYYDPNVGRFINADDAEYISIGNTVNTCNIFCYCQNGPTQTKDPNGHGPFLAIGIQFVLMIGPLTFGLEALWSTKNWKFYLFGFIGGSRSINIASMTQTENALMEDIIYLIRSVRKFSFSSFSLFKRLSVSVSFVAVLGNKIASFPKDYCGWFTGISLSFWHITVAGAYSFSKRIKIGSLGIGATTSKANVSFGQMFYFQLTGNNAMKNSLEALKSGIQSKLAFLKLFVCFF